MLLLARAARLRRERAGKERGCLVTTSSEDVSCMAKKCPWEKKRGGVEVGRKRKILWKGSPGRFASRSGQKSGRDGGTGRSGWPGRGSGKISGQTPEVLHWFKLEGSKCSLAQGARLQTVSDSSRSTLPSLCGLTTQVCVGEEGTPVRKWTDTPATLRALEGPLREKPPLHGNVPP